jgi:hypothetical protein
VDATAGGAAVGGSGGGPAPLRPHGPWPPALWIRIVGGNGPLSSASASGGGGTVGRGMGAVTSGAAAGAG